jgi:hypothetical protein
VNFRQQVVISILGLLFGYILGGVLFSYKLNKDDWECQSINLHTKKCVEYVYIGDDE